MKIYDTETINAMKACLEMPQFVEQKTEVVLIANRRRRKTISTGVGGYIITSEPLIKYLVVMTDVAIKGTPGLCLLESVSLAWMADNIADITANYLWPDWFVLPCYTLH